MLNAQRQASSYWPVLLFFLLSCIFLWRIFTGEVFLPAELLRHLAPWSANYSEQERPPWNPLMYDSVGQFYPWRKFASETIRSGFIPLWNPYQFCGTPFVANSQSAVFYPGNLLFYALPVDIAAGWTVILHLTLAATFMWLFVRALGVSSAAAVLSGVAFAFSSWQVSWLHLPTFLTTSCWLPLVLLLIVRLFESVRWQTAVGLGFAFGMTLLAGHLQIAFYVLLSAVLLAVWLSVSKMRESGWKGVRTPLGLLACGFFLAGMLAGPQLLPTLELSRYSHRAGAPTEAGYAAYTAYAASPLQFITTLVPDFFGNPSRSGSQYVGMSRSGSLFNYAEGAMYAGLATLLLAIFGLFGIREFARWRWIFGIIAALALLMAFGTPINRLLYFYVPGFGSSGSPARVLILWTFAISALAGIGAHGLVYTSGIRWKVLMPAMGVLCGLWTFTYVRASGWVASAWNLSNFSPLDASRQVLFLALAAGLIWLAAAKRIPLKWTLAIPIALVGLDLFAVGINYNPTASRAEVYPVTPGIRFLQQYAGHNRIMPINQNWSMFGPKAVLPPNAAMVYGLRDLQGYDSLFPKQFKAFLNRAQGTDSSPPEVGNMVFAKRRNEELAAESGVRIIVLSSGSSEVDSRAGPSIDVGLHFVNLAHGADSGRLVSRSDDGRPGSAEWREDSATRVSFRATLVDDGYVRLADQFFPGWIATLDGRPVAISRDSAGVFRTVQVPAGEHPVTFTYAPTGFRLGLFLMCLALAVGGLAVGAKLARKGSRYAVSTI